ncbi:MAG: metallophosphoesterase [Oscillospiraceae bacterium]|nr:metallophosphoesterase [Oscillospiraceae bacterium]
MSVFAISDVHLSFGTKNKDMSIFKGWSNHSERLRANWNRTVSENDTVVIGGDISWGKTLFEALPDFLFIDKELNGKKLILKGNHDYWWTTLVKMRKWLSDNGALNIDFLYNNAYRIDNLTICGTRGYINSENDKENVTSERGQKMLLREAARLEASIKAGLELGGEPIVFLHYPPIYSIEENENILKLLNKYVIKRVFSGHIHLSGIDKAFIGKRNETYFDTITADFLDFTPKKIL